jgi:protein gp37
MKLHNQRHEANKDVATEGLRRIGQLQLDHTGSPVHARGCGAKLPMPPQYDRPFDKIQLLPARLSEPLRWRKPRTVAVCFMGDWMHEDVPDEFVLRMYDVMLQARQHTYLMLTKRPERMRHLFSLSPAASHIWLGVTAENQRMADERIPLLLDTPAAHRWASLEPLLGPVDLEEWLPCGDPQCEEEMDFLDWVVVGGESGPGHRPLQHSWVYDIKDQCKAAGVAFWGKQDAGARPGIPLGGGLDVHELPWHAEPPQEEGI